MANELMKYEESDNLYSKIGTRPKDAEKPMIYLALAFALMSC